MAWLDRIVSSLGLRRHDETAHGLALAALDAGAPDGHVGVVCDVSIEGATLLWPRPLGLGARLSLSIACAHEQSGINVRITRASGRGPVGRFFVHECRPEPTPALEAFGERVGDLHLAHARATDATPSLARWSLRHRLGRAPRHRIHLPVRVTTPSGAIVAVTRDLSVTGLSLVTGGHVQVGDPLALEIAAAEQRWTGQVTVARCEHLTDTTSGAIHLWGLRFDTLDTQRDIGRFREWIAV